MDIKSFKELEKLLKICRKAGVSDIEVSGLKIKLGDVPFTEKSSSVDMKFEEPENPFDNFPTGHLTPSQAAFYSAGGMPENDPELQMDEDTPQ